MNILFYTPVNFRCREIESLTQKFIADGHKVFFVSHAPEGTFHVAMAKLGAKTFVVDVSPKSSIALILQRVNKLISFCRVHKIDVCLSHLEPTNFISVLAQFFLRTRFVIYRHHIDEAKLRHFDRSIAYRLTYKLAKTIICVSRQAKEYMVEVEKVHANKIFHINLGYNFKLYDAPNENEVNTIRAKYPEGILLLSVGRLTEYKRPVLSLQLIKAAYDAGIECSLIFLGAGEEEASLRNLATEYSVADRVSFVGYSQQVLNYMAVADLLVHPSILESSCVVVKEAALVRLPVMVCGGVGDFDDYMTNGVNGIVVPRNKFVEDGLRVLQDYSRDSRPYKKMGAALREEIISRFNIDTVFPEYQKLLGV